MGSPTEPKTDSSEASEYRNGVKHGYLLAMFIYAIGTIAFVFGIYAEEKEIGDDDGGDSED